MSSFSVQVVGLDKALELVDPKKWDRGLRRGLLKVGQRAADDVKADIAPHHYTGRAEQQVHAQEEHGGRISVYVGTSAALVPELRPMVEGWKSESGHQPPSAAIAEWLAHKPNIGFAAGSSAFRVKTGKGIGGMLGPSLVRKGTIATTTEDKTVKGLAFVIARSIAKKGYKFGKTDSFAKVWSHLRAGAPRTIASEIETELRRV